MSSVVVGPQGELVTVPTFGDPDVTEAEYQREVIWAFLDNVDPVALEALALEHMADLNGGEASTGAAFLAALRELVSD